MGNLCSTRDHEEQQNCESQRNVVKPRLLNGKEKKVIKTTWKKLGCENQQGLIRTVWLTAAERSPRIKQILGLEEEAEESERFQKINKEVHEFFDHLIVDMKLENDEVLEACYLMGLRHSEFSQNEFQPVFWDIFLVSLVEAMEKQELKGVSEGNRWFAIYSWHKFAHFIVNQMLQGYREAIHFRLSNLTCPSFVCFSDAEMHDFESGLFIILGYPLKCKCKKL